MSRVGGTVAEDGMKEWDGCDEDCWWRGLFAAVQVGSDGGSFS